MEMQIDETSEEHSFLSPRRRRRSTFFERRLSLAPEHQSENINDELSKKNNSKHKEEIARYYENLLEEKNKWLMEVKDRRHMYHDLRQECETLAKSINKSRISYAALTTEDIEFLKGKPKIIQIAESQQKLHNSVKETKQLFWKVVDLDDVILNHCEDVVYRLTEHLLDNSTVDQIDRS